MTPADKRENAGLGGTALPRNAPSNCSPVLEGLLLRLCTAIEAQTQAITELARSNEALVDSLIQGEDEQDEAGSRHL